MGMVQASLAEHGTTWFTTHQTAGRGQRGKVGHASPGDNLAMSTVVVPKGLSLSDQFYLSMAVALASADFFQHYALQYTCIKWPNDIYWKDRKAGGILIENVLQGSEWRYAVIGIGFNINQVVFDPMLANPVSLKQITGKSFDILPLVTLLCQCLEKRWRLLVDGERKAILTEYNERLYKLNQIVTLKKGNATLQARVLGASGQGELLIDTGTVTSVPFGSVEWVIG